MLNCLAVGAGGFLGAVLRYLCSLLPLGRDGGFPVGTLLVNVLGAFAIGLIAAAAARHAALSPRMILFLKTGICGGFISAGSRPHRKRNNCRRSSFPCVCCRWFCTTPAQRPAPPAQAAPNREDPS